MAVLLLAAVSGLWIVPSVRAQTTRWGWAVSKAEVRLDTEYRTRDPWSWQGANENLAFARSLGDPGAIAQAQRDVKTAERAARVEWAHCSGLGDHWKAAGAVNYARFNCRIHIASPLTPCQDPSTRRWYFNCSISPPPSCQGRGFDCPSSWPHYEATLRITLRVTGRESFVVTKGWQR
jgi:hypothetical protein